jgi:hypothetical protein
MPRTKRIIDVPRPEAGSYNPNRPLARNHLLLNQVRHFRMVEEGLPPEKRTGIKTEAVTTEGEAAEYIRKMTQTLHQMASKAGGE